MMKKLLALLLALGLLGSCAMAELTAEPAAEEPALDPAVKPLAMDTFDPGYAADEACYTEDGYQDASLTVAMSHVMVGDARFNVARVRIAHPSQLRTALAGTLGKKTNKISTMARNSNAVIAIGGDYCGDRNNGYVVRQSQVFRTKLAKTLDILLVDQNGDFHIILSSNSAELKALLDSGVTPVNVFNFGPALVVDGVKQTVKNYANFNPKGNEPRCAIGQVGPLEYLLVVVDGRGAAGSNGCTMEELAQYMMDEGCINAFNLDGGNSSLMVFHGENYSEKSFSAERSVSDIIYFATAVDPEAK